VEKLVIIPTYNEKENISNILHAIFNLNDGFHVLVIDDGSPDGTAQIVKELVSKFSDKLFIEERIGKLGLGTAYIHGFKWAIEKDYQFIFEIDADFSHNPNDLPRLYNACKNEGADVAVGSRYVKGGGVVNWPSNRIALSKGAYFNKKIETRKLFKFSKGDPSTIFVNNSTPNAIALNDMLSWPANVVVGSSNNLSNRITLHLIDNYLRKN